MKIYGFTGTSKGMTQKQRATFRYLLNELKVTELHHGDCIGADSQAHVLCRELNVHITVHPPIADIKRVFCQARPNVLILDPKPYLVRNRDIVAAGINGLIATPKDFVQPSNLRGQGTWTTIGYARKSRRSIHIIFPDGTFSFEEEL